MKRIAYLIYLFSILSFSQPSSDGMYFDGVDDFFRVPGTSNINSSTTNNRTYETYFKVTSTAPRQVIMEEGGGTRAVVFYVDNGYLVVGAYNRADYTPKWQGTFYRKAISANTWYHLAFVFDNAQPGNASTNPMNTSANTALKWYLNGVLQDQISGYQFGPHNATVLGYKDGTLRLPNCGTWTTSGLSEYCFGNLANDTGSGEYYFQGNLWGYRMWSDVRTLAEINDNMDTIITSVGTDNLVAFLDGDSFTYLDSSNNPLDVSNTNPALPITWKANAGSTDWNAPSNWTGGAVPDATKKESAIIQVSTNYPVITSHVIAGDVAVNSGAEITINDGGTLDVNYDLVNNGTILVNNNGSLINRESKAVSGTGTFNLNRDTPNYPTDYYSIWSTPMVESDSQIGSIFTNAIKAYEYDSSQNPSAYVQKGGATNMKVGKGYFIRSDNDSGVITRTFSGIVNNGNINETVNHNSPTDNYNVIGNPYPSAVNWLKIHEDNSDVLLGTMYYWSQSYVGVNNLASDWIDFNSTGSSVPGTTGDIAAGQGISVRSSQAGKVTFKNTQRVVGSNNHFFRSSGNPDDGKSWFRLTGPTNVYSPILIGFIPEATDGYENSYDGEFINEGASIEFYSLINDDKFSIQGRSALQSNQLVQVPIGFQVTTAGDFTISKVRDYIDTSFEILLEDTLLNTMTDLRTLDYTFNVASPTEDNSRFIMHYNYNSTLGVDENEITSNSISSFFLIDELRSKVNSVELPKTIQLFDITGKEILNTSFKASLQTKNLSTGIYVVIYGFDDSKVVSKKLLKNKIPNTL